MKLFQPSFKIIIAILYLFLAHFTDTKAQSGIEGVSYKLKYNTDSCWYDVYLIINAGSATTPIERLQFNSAITFVIPTGTTLSIPRGYMPLINNNAGNGIQEVLQIVLGFLFI
jgi:hypothetical protein